MNYVDYLWIVFDLGIFKEVVDIFFIFLEENYIILLKVVIFFLFYNVDVK